MKPILNKNFIITFLLFLIIGFSVILLNNQEEKSIAQSNISVVNNSQLVSQAGASSESYVQLSKGFFETRGELNMQNAFDTIYRWMLAAAIVSAVIVIIWGGIQYMTIDSISGKQDGLSKVKGAIAGLLLAVSSAVILNTIDPRILGTSSGGEGLTDEQINNYLSDDEINSELIRNMGPDQPYRNYSRSQDVSAGSTPSDREFPSVFNQDQ